MLRHDRPGPSASRGFSLAELMVAIALGLFLVSGIAYMMFETAKASRQSMLEAHLRQIMTTVMSVMTGELRRAGYWSRAGMSGEDLLHNGYAALRLVTANCLLYSYDQEGSDTDGVPDPGDRHGLRLAGGALQIKTSDPGCGASCENCNSGNWLALTDPQTVTITRVEFAASPKTIYFSDGEHAATVREIAITLEGRLRQEPAVRHRLYAKVDIRNDEIR